MMNPVMCRHILAKNYDFRRHHGAATPFSTVVNRCKVDLYLALNPKTWK